MGRAGVTLTLDSFAATDIILFMTHRHDRFGFDIIVELIAAEQSQSPDGSPIDRVETRLGLSLGLARRAGLDGLELHLDRRDFAWLCNARVVDRLSRAASLMKVDGVAVRRAKAGFETHITGTFVDGREDGVHPFPVVGDPSLVLGFVHHITSEDEKAAMRQRFVAEGRMKAVQAMTGNATVH